MAQIPNKERVINGVKNGANKALVVVGKVKDGAVDGAAKMRRDMSIKRFQPVWGADFEQNNVKLPGVLRIIDDGDKRFLDPACDGAVGFREKYTDKEKRSLDVLCVLDDYLEEMNICFLPNYAGRLYKRHPFLPDTYIDLDQYFDFIQTRRVSELQEIARMLGAKHVRVSLQEEKKRYLSSDATAKAKVKKKGAANANLNASRKEEQKEYDAVAIKVDTTFEGSNAPKQPELVFFRHEDEILNLINAKMSGENSVLSKKLSVRCDHSIGMKLDEAIAIDVMLDKLKWNVKANASYKSSVEQEARSMLQYEIEF